MQSENEGILIDLSVRARGYQKYDPSLANAPKIGAPAIGTPAIGTPAIGTPAIGTPAIGTPAFGKSSFFGD